MGVSIEVWRGRIGCYGSHRQRGRRREKNTGQSNLIISLVAAAVIVALLAIGNVELNPGPLPCKHPSCEIVAETISSSVRHQHYHSNDSNFLYYCPAPDCFYFTKSFNALNFHVSQFHRETRHHSLDSGADGDTSDQISCLVEGCSHSVSSFWNLVQHSVEHLDSGTPVQCPVEDCVFGGLFKKASTFRVHLSQYHRGWRDEGCPVKRKRVASEDENFVREDQTFVAEGHSEPLFQDTFTDEDHDLDQHNNNLFFDKIAKFYLQLYTDCLPYSTIQDISSALTFISEVNASRIKKVLQDGLISLGVEQHKINWLAHKVLNADALYTVHHKTAPGPSLTSDYLRREWFKKNYNFQEPVEINLSDDPNSKKKLQYVPLTQTLSTLLEDPTVQKDIDESFLKVPSNGDEVSDYTERSQFQEEDHQPKEIHLHLYQDSYNPVMNALGSAKNKFKSLVVYFTLGNFKAANRSKIDAKHLVLMIRESIFKKVGAKKCFERLMEELKKLQEGIMYKGQRVKVRVQYMLGDSLGQHLVGGFIESFSSRYFCRFCDIKRCVFKADPTQTKPQRSREDYKFCVMKAQLTEKNCKGIKQNCVFNDLENFHAVSHLPPCIAHDLFEGVVSWDLAGIIRSFVKKKKWFKYKLLNKRIKRFKCNGIDASNKPAYVTKDGEKLGGHAVQNWSLLRLLPFIIGDKIKDFNDPGWKLYLQLKDLCEFFCAHSFLKSDVSYIRDILLPLYFQQRSVVLDQSRYPLKPKHHYMVHYPELMLRYGPLIHLWTLAFEQKHKFFKHLCRLSRNFINVEYTCAVRHQMALAYHATGPMFPDGVMEANSKELHENSYEGELKAFLIEHNQIGCRESSAVTVDGVLHQKGSLILLSPDGQDIVCGVIRVILCYSSGVFVLECFKAAFSSEVGIYVLPADATGELKLVPGKGLKYAQPQPVYDFKGKLSFSVKSKVI